MIEKCKKNRNFQNFKLVVPLNVYVYACNSLNFVHARLIHSAKFLMLMRWRKGVLVTSLQSRAYIVATITQNSASR